MEEKNKFVTFLSKLLSKSQEVIKNCGKHIATFFKGIPCKIKIFFTNLGNKFKNAGISIARFFKSLPSNIKLLGNKIKSLAIVIGHAIIFLFTHPKESYKNIKHAVKNRKQNKKYNKFVGFFDLRKSHNILSVLGHIIVYIVMIVVAYIFLKPLIDMLTKSFMTTKDLINPEVFYISTAPTIKNYPTAMEVLDLWNALFNSIWFSAVLAICQTVVSALAAYAFARLAFKGKKLCMAFLLLAFIVPTPVLIVPRITIFDSIGTLIHFNFFGTIIPNILVTVLGQGVYSTILILIFYNFFKQIPYDLDEAAYLDGANSFQVLWHVIIKLSLPVILTVFLFSFVWNWNESLMTSTFVGSSLKLIPSQLNLFDSLFSKSQASGGYDLNEGYKMAATVVSVLPLIILYLIVQKQFIEGIEQSGITGQ